MVYYSLLADELWAQSPLKKISSFNTLPCRALAKFRLLKFTRFMLRNWLGNCSTSFSMLVSFSQATLPKKRFLRRSLNGSCFSLIRRESSLLRLGNYYVQRRISQPTCLDRPLPVPIIGGKAWQLKTFSEWRKMGGRERAGWSPVRRLAAACVYWWDERRWKWEMKQSKGKYWKTQNLAGGKSGVTVGRSCRKGTRRIAEQKVRND